MDGYSEKILKAVAKKLGDDLFTNEDQDVHEMICDDIFFVLKRNNPPWDGAILADRFCFDNGEDISEHMVGVFSCATLYANLFDDHGIDFFEKGKLDAKSGRKTRNEKAITRKKSRS